MNGSKKKALITGAARRLGRATALAMARAGLDIVVHYDTSSRPADELVLQLRSLGSNAWALRADLSHPGQTDLLMKQAQNLAGKIDILVNNASIFSKSRIRDFNFEDLMQNMRVNAFSPLVLSRCFAEQAKSGVIVNLLDSRITGPDGEHAAYHLSKRALFVITKMLALELAPRIRVNGVAPGLILPPPGEDSSYLEENKQENPLLRYGSPEAVSDAVLYLANSTFVTGQVIFVDGGRHLLGSLYD